MVPGERTRVMKEFAIEIIAELLKTDIEVLEELRETWIEEAKRQGLSGAAVRFCEVALELVIEKKMGVEK